MGDTASISLSSAPSAIVCRIWRGGFAVASGRDQRYAGRRLTTDGNHLPNLLSPARVPLLTAPRALVEGLASPFPKTTAPPRVETRTLVLGRERALTTPLLTRWVQPPGPFPERGIRESVGRRSSQPPGRAGRVGSIGRFSLYCIELAQGCTTDSPSNH